MPKAMLMAIVVSLAAPLLMAQREFPGCEAAFGPGYTQHPDYATSCCWPGLVPVPGEPRCVRPDDPAVTGGPPQVRDAEGNIGAPGGHCIPLNMSCTLGGAPCCEGACGGTFPNTTCR